MGVMISLGPSAGVRADQNSLSPLRSILSREKGCGCANRLAGFEAAPVGRVKSVRRSREPELFVNSRGRSGQERPKQDGEHTADFRQVVKHLVQSFSF